MNPMNIFFFELLLISIREGAPHKHDVLWDRAFEHLHLHLHLVLSGRPKYQSDARARQLSTPTMTHGASILPSGRRDPTAHNHSPMYFIGSLWGFVLD